VRRGSDDGDSASTAGSRWAASRDVGEADEGEGGCGVGAAQCEKELGGGSPAARGRKQSRA
jgi:hypothetical protein